MGHIESQLRIKDAGNLTYQHLIDMLYHEDNNFSVNIPLSNNDILNILTLVSNELEKLILRPNGKVLKSSVETIEDKNFSTMYDLKDKLLSKDVSMYWELCNCYE